MHSSVLVLVLAFSLSAAATGRMKSLRVRDGDNSNEEEAIAFLETYNTNYSFIVNKYVLASWAYNTNLTEENAEKESQAAFEVSQYDAVAFVEASQFNTTNFDPDVKRQLSYVGSKTLSDEEMMELSTLISTMGTIYGSTCLQKPDGECLYLEPGLTQLMSDSRDVAERLWAWDEWRKEVGRKMKPHYLKYVDLKNKLAVLNGYADYGDQLRQKYEVEDFESDVKNIYDELRPLYLQLHAYIRRKLAEQYPGSVDLRGTLPQHLLGDMWGRFWTNLYAIAVPYPDEQNLDVTEEMKRQNYTPKKMFEMGDDFFKSMGLKGIPDEFFNLSMIEKPDDDTPVICHATAWDFYDGKDFRVKMCTDVNMDQFLTVHHELGHTQYQMQYADKHVVYRDGANDGFHEAVGELMSTCVATPKHLHQIGLLEEIPNNNETEINFLMSVALSSVSALPFHYLNDLWRWRAFRGDYGNDTDTWNTEFWNLSKEIVGVHAPVERTPDDLDCPTIFHVNQDYDMIRYFTRTILQFQFYEALCIEAEHEGKLNECDFYNSTAAGTKLASMLSMGSSQPWPEAMFVLTGQKNMDARALREYFQPLEDWLTKTNAANGDSPGWDEDGSTAVPTSTLGPSSTIIDRGSSSTEGVTSTLEISSTQADDSASTYVVTPILLTLAFVAAALFQ